MGSEIEAVMTMIAVSQTRSGRRSRSWAHERQHTHRMFPFHDDEQHDDDDCVSRGSLLIAYSAPTCDLLISFLPVAP